MACVQNLASGLTAGFGQASARQNKKNTFFHKSKRKPLSHRKALRRGEAAFLLSNVESKAPLCFKACLGR